MRHPDPAPQREELPRAYTLPAAEQPEKRLRDWFAAVERYPRQLHDMGRDEYLWMKHRELARQQATPVEAKN